MARSNSLAVIKPVLSEHAKFMLVRTMLRRTIVASFAGRKVGSVMMRKLRATMARREGKRAHAT